MNLSLNSPFPTILGMSDSSRRFLIGYALAPKRQQSFIQPSLLDVAKSRGIDLVPIDSERLLSDQGPFDIILHKLYSESWKSQLLDYTCRNPNVIVIDPPDAIQRLRNRISMLKVVSELTLPQQLQTFGIPNQIVIYDSATLSDPDMVAGLQFPVISKPIVADGSTKSHEMSLVFNVDGLKKLKPPIVLQEFISHGGVLFKVYVVGEYVKCVKRQSLPDVSEKMLDCSDGLLPFSRISNVATVQEWRDESEIEVEMPPFDFIKEIAGGLLQVMQVHMFNFDVIRDAKVGNHYLILDINYFPGYEKMPSYETVLTDFFLDLLHQNKMER